MGSLKSSRLSHRVTWQVRKRTLALTLQVQQMLACKLGKPECTQ